MDDEASEIVEAIHEAFDGVERGEITLHEAEVIDRYGSERQRTDARRLDTERTWREIPDRHVEECTTALCHVDPASWRYYVPRYMEWSLHNFETVDSIVPDSTIYTFDLIEAKPDLAEYAMTRFRQLTTAQSEVVSRFLRYMARHPCTDDVAAREALRKYWGRFGGATEE